ncbi:FtsW/RodA/SpoVE family cell cycle protein [Candidatus Agathobaculum pullicola]|uniref:FtsW/RodA/SpoVE family cell cycle protein n=1 Tax=Candidatus Agathobaculum pullicola TaxID=2838426 RepID=UPI003F916C96
MTDALQRLLDMITGFLAENPLVGAWYTTVARFVFPILALMILVGAIRSLWKVKHPDEVWGYLAMANGVRLPITHWENIIGRAPSCDVQIEYPSVSRQHAALIREDDGSWTVYDLGSKGGVTVNDLPVDEYAVVEDGDTVTFAGIPTMLIPISVEEKRDQMVERRMEGRPAGMWGSLVLLTLFQVLTTLQLIVAAGDKATVTIPLTFLVLTLVCWGYFIILRSFRRIGFEMETIAFFLCTLSLAVTGSTVPDEMPKQLIAILMGLAIFLILGFFLRDLTRAQKVRWFMGAAAVGLLVITLLIGSSQGGAKAWIRLGGMSLQPSELAKICYIFAGAATLDRLFNKRNLWMFIGLTGICGACLALQNDFGTALVFFVTFLVIAFLRSGDFATLGLICAGCFAGGMVLLTVKGHVAARFSSWGHIWEDVYGAGFQQTHTLTAAASGGMIGVGAGKGWLSGLAAADTDIVFGMLCEEWGLIIAILTILCIITLAVFAVRACRAGRSSFYTIAACAATSLLVFQTCLNVFGAVDILPFTGVTLPFVSNGGSSMLSAWGMLAFLKATDTRQNASFAVKLPSRRELRGEVD